MNEIMTEKRKNILIYGRNFHARAAFRKLCLDDRRWNVIGFIDDEYSGNIFLERKVYPKSMLSSLKFDSIVIAGRYMKEMRTFILESGIDSEKIWEMSRSEYQPSFELLRQRSRETYDLLRILLEFLSRNTISFWFVASTLLALKRNQDLAWFADVDIVIPYDHLKVMADKLRYLAFSDNVTIHKHSEDGAFWRRGEIYQIVLKTNTDPLLSEPAIIDIHALRRIDDKAYYSIGDASFLCVNSKHFEGSNFHHYLDLALPIPLNEEEYLQATYGESWYIPVEYFSANDHLGRLDIR